MLCVEKIEEKLQELLNEIMSLQSQLKEEKSKISLEDDTNCHIDFLVKNINDSRKKITKANNIKETLLKKLNRLSKLDDSLTRLFWPILITGSIISLALIFKSFLATLIGYAVTMGLTFALGAIVLKIEGKQNIVVSEISEQNRIINIENVTVSALQEIIDSLQSQLMKQYQIDFVKLNIENIRENIAYNEESIWNILQGIKPENDTEYIRKVREDFYPTIFIPEDESSKKLIPTR